MSTKNQNTGQPENNNAGQPANQLNPATPAGTRPSPSKAVAEDDVNLRIRYSQDCGVEPEFIDELFADIDAGPLPNDDVARKKHRDAQRAGRIRYLTVVNNLAKPYRVALSWQDLTGPERQVAIELLAKCDSAKKEALSSVQKKSRK